MSASSELVDGDDEARGGCGVRRDPPRRHSQAARSGTPDAQRRFSRHRVNTVQGAGCGPPRPGEQRLRVGRSWRAKVEPPL